MTRTTTYRGIAVVAGLILALLMITATSRAAWTDTTSNDGNSIASGTVVLTDDDDNNAMFSITNAAPGDSWNGCIDVIYQGSVGADVAITDIHVTAALVADAALAADLDMTVDLYTDASCTTGGTSVSGPVALSTYTGGGDPAFGEDWGVSASGDHRSYGFTIDFDSLSGDASQGGTVTFNVEWTATSN